MKDKMRKGLLFGGMLMMICPCIHAQNWQEWTQQNKTQRKYLLQQIAALQVYLGYAKEGYDIANKELTAIGKIKKGDFDLHDEYFASLKKVNPSIATSAKVAAIIAKQIQIIKEAKETIDGVTQSHSFTSEEMAHCNKVFENMLGSCIEAIDELIALTTSSQYEMKDDERIKRIDALYVDMQNKYAFTVAYSTEMGLLSMQRTSEQAEIKYSKKLREGL